MTRSPAVSGAFYPGSKKNLLKKIDDVYCDSQGVGHPLSVKKNPRCVSTAGIISPHAGYAFSGPCASYGYNFLSQFKHPDFYLLLGGSHYGEPTSFSDEDWETPFGKISPAKEVIRRLSSDTSVPVDNDKHRMEHSIEVQIPFLQHLFNLTGKTIPVIPLHLSRDRDMTGVGVALAHSLEDYRVFVIISSDFTHQGPRFSYTPFRDDVLKNIEKLDKDAVDKICLLDINGFCDIILKTSATICGYLPIMAGMAFLKERGIKQGTLLKYYTSAEMTGDFTNTVSYASIIFN